MEVQTNERHVGQRANDMLTRQDNISASRPFERFLDILILIGALATVPLTVLLEEHQTGGLIATLDWVVWAIFVFEYIARCAIDPRRLRSVRTGLFPLAVVILSFPLLPAVLGLVRLARLSRTFRALRLLSTIARGMAELRVIFARKGVAYLIGLASLLIVAGGAALALVEPSTVRGGFVDGVWWAIVTASTVGYGDIAPTTVVGRVIAVVIMLAGVGLISTLAASITAYFVGQTGNPELAELRDRIVRLEGRIDRLLAVIDADTVSENRTGSPRRQ